MKDNPIQKMILNTNTTYRKMFCNKVAVHPEYIGKKCKFILTKGDRKGLECGKAFKRGLNACKEKHVCFVQPPLIEPGIVMVPTALLQKPINHQKNVLEICEPPCDIDIDMLKRLVHEYMKPRTPFYKACERTFFIEPEFSEWWIAKTSNGECIGNGHNAMDVITNARNGVDTTCLVMNGKLSNEKSLIQNFKDAGSNLDLFFKNKNDVDAVALFREDYYNKISDVKNKYNLTGLYICAFISTIVSIKCIWLKINTESIKYISSGGFVNARDDCVNIKVENFISSEYGTVKLYKSKKRMELRFHSAVIDNPNVIDIYKCE